MTIKVQLKKFYIFLVTGLLAFIIIINSSLKNVIELQTYKSINIGLLFLMALMSVIGILFYKHVTDYIYLLMIIIMIIIWHSSANLQMILFISLFCLLSPTDVVRIYKYGISIGLMSVVIFAMMGIISKYNDQGTNISLGFSNENVGGFYLTFLSVLFLIKFVSEKAVLKFTISNTAFLLVSLLFDFLIFKDATASVIPFVFVGLYVLSQLYGSKILFKICVTLFPIILALSSIWVGYYFGVSNWTYKLNQLITLRPFIWHYYLHNYPIGPFATKWIINSNWVGGAFDGSYVYWVVFNGYVLTALLTLGLAIVNWKLAENKEWAILSVLIALELSGISENMLFSFYQSFGVVFAILAFRMQWIRKNRNKTNIIKG